MILLALFASLLLLAAGTSFYFFLNSSQAAMLDSAEKHLVVLANSMRSDYAAQVAHGFSLEQVPRPPRPPHPPPPPPPPPPRAPREAALDGPLAQITVAVLRRESDVEGGFYSKDADTLVGYAFPTHEGPGGRGEVPGKERPAIEELARAAARTGTLQKQSFHGSFDAILFVAVPVRDGDRITGAAWLMQRMPGLEAGRSKQLLLGSLGFAAAAVTCALLTFFITSEVNAGVQTVLARLSSMEGSLSARAREPVRPQLAEFEQVLQRVDELSDALQQKIETQRALEDEVRHRQRLSALGQFAAGVAHELRNPLATIRLRTQMSQRAEVPATVARNCEVVLDEVVHLDSMIQRLLYFSRPIHLQLKPVQVAQLCQQSLASWAPRCAALAVQLRYEAPEELAVLCDASKIRQVLDNLLENALESVVAGADARGAIELRCAGRADLVAIEVRDNGAGLQPEAQLRALEPFFTTKDTGTGLGLSISYEIAQAHGGDLQLDSGAEGGAIATLCLPRASNYAGDDARSEQEERCSQTSS